LFFLFAGSERRIDMHLFWGALMVVIGLFLFICASLKSEIYIYQLLVARSRMMWKDNVYLSHKVAGILIITMGLLMALKLL